MCDTGDIVDVAAGIGTGGASYAIKKATGRDLPSVDIAKAALGLNGQKTPVLPELPAAPEIPNLSDELIKRAASAQRLRQMMTQGVGLTGVMGLPTPTRIPGLGGA